MERPKTHQLIVDQGGEEGERKFSHSTILVERWNQIGSFETERYLSVPGPSLSQGNHPNKETFHETTRNPTSNDQTRGHNSKPRFKWRRLTFVYVFSFNFNQRVSHRNLTLPLLMIEKIDKLNNVTLPNENVKNFYRSLLTLKSVLILREKFSGENSFRWFTKVIDIWERNSEVIRTVR